MIETHDRGRAGAELDLRTVDLARLVQPGAALACPTCGMACFTVACSTEGDLVLSCWREPTHLRIIMEQRPEVISG